jgi:hypothetical protein
MFAGAILGLAAAVLFEEPLRNRLRRMEKKRMRSRGKSEADKLASGVQGRDATFSFGPLRTTILVVDGNGETPYRPRNIQVRVENKAVSLPPELRAIRKQIERREDRKREAGSQYLWNGLNFAVDSFSVTRTGLTEESEVSLGLKLSDYYTFLAAKESLDKYVPKYGKTVREQYLEPFYWSRPVSFLSSSFGVNISVVTADDQLVVCRRSEVVGSRPLEYTVSANEGLSRGIDDQGGVHVPDLYACGYRALDEELGVEKWDVDKLEILAFVVDLQLHQWGCLGWARLSDMTYSELRERHVRAAKDRFENIELDSVPFTPRAVADYVLEPNRRAYWYGGAPVSFYLALVLNFGRRSVERSIKEAAQRGQRSG